MQSKSTSKETKNISSELQEEKIGKLINFSFSLYKQYQVKPSVILKMHTSVFWRETDGA